MVDLRTQNRRLRELLEVVSLLAPDVPEEELHEFVTTTYADAKLASHNGTHAAVNAGERQQDSDGLPIYDELPAGLIDLPAAAAKYGRSRSTLHRWLNRRYIRLAGRLRAPARGGGYLVLYEEDLRRRLAGPVNKGGRPRKT